MHAIFAIAFDIEMGCEQGITRNPGLRDSGGYQESMVALSRMPDRQQTLSAVLRSRIDWLLLGLDATTMLVISVLVHLDEGGYAEAVGIVGVALTLVSLEVAGLYRSRLTLSALDDLPRLAAWSIISSGTVLAVARPGESITRTAAYATLVFVALFVVRTAYYIFVRRRRRRSPAGRMRAMCGALSARLTSLPPSSCW